MPSTSPDNIYYVDANTPLSVEAESSMQAASIQRALSQRLAIKSFKWEDQSDQDAQSDMAPGDLGYRLDIDRFFYFDGYGWRPLVEPPSEWVPLTAVSPFAGSVLLRREGDRVVLQGSISRPSGSGGYTTALVIPPEFRPSEPVGVLIGAPSPTVAARAQVLVNGDFQVHVGSAASGGMAVTGTTWFLDTPSQL